MQSAELQAKFAVWRQRIKDGTMTVDDYKEAIMNIRGDRKSAAISSEKSKVAKAKAAVPDAKALLGALGKL